MCLAERDTRECLGRSTDLVRVMRSVLGSPSSAIGAIGVGVERRGEMRMRPRAVPLIHEPAVRFSRLVLSKIFEIFQRPESPKDGKELLRVVLGDSHPRILGSASPKGLL